MSKRAEWEGVSGRGIVGLVLGLAFLAVIFGTLTAALIGVPGMPLWPVVTTAVITLAAVLVASAAAAAWLMEVPEHNRQAADLVRQLPPVQHAQRYAADPNDWLTLTWRPERQGPRLTWQCPVQPGKPRTVRDLRRETPRDLRSRE